MDETDNKRKKTATHLLTDDRFKALFNNPDFEVDKNADEYKMLTPVLSRLDKNKTKELKKKVETTMAFEDENEAKSSDDDLFSENDENNESNESSDDDDRGWQQELKRNYRANRRNQKFKNAEDGKANQDDIENDSDIADESSKHSMAAPNLEFAVKNIRDSFSK